MNEYKKELKQIDVLGLAVGAIIGWGCFVLPGTDFLPKAGTLGTFLGFLLGAVIIMIISLSYGYLIAKYPEAGGEYIYAKTAFGRKAAFVCGWFIVLAYWSLIPMNATALAMISRYIFPGIVQVGKLYNVAGFDVYLGEIILAYAFIIGIAFLNIKGIKGAGWLQTAVALTMVAAIIFATVGVCLTKGDMTNLNPGFPEGKTPVAAVFAIVAYAPYSFIGFDCIPQASEEYGFSHKKSRLIMLGAIFLASILYISVAMITAAVEPWQDLLASDPFWATGQVIEESLGKPGIAFIAIAMFCAVVSGINAFMISTSRLMQAMAKEEVLPGVFAEITSTGHTPKNAILFIMGISLVAPWFGRKVLSWIVDMTAVGGGMAFCFTCLAAVVIAKREKDLKQMWISIIGFLVASIFLVLVMVPGMPGFLCKESAILLVIWIVMGIVFYALRKKSGHLE
ncbi:MAG: APC family permease [Lachnospiraceae bacterium]|nr:APC family permease [Lachnospiraceae bacterium]